MKTLIFFLLLTTTSFLSAQHAAPGGRSARNEAKKYGIKSDAWNWVIPTTRKSDWYAYPIIGQVRDARIKLVYFYDKRMTRNKSDYYYIDEYERFIVLRWIPKDRIIWQRE